MVSICSYGEAATPSGSDNDWRGGDAGADRQPFDAGEIGVAQGTEFLLAHVRAAGVDPGDQPMQSGRWHLHVVVLAADGQLDQPAVVGEVLHRRQRGQGVGIVLLVAAFHRNRPRDAVAGCSAGDRIPPAGRSDQRQVRLLENTVPGPQGEVRFVDEGRRPGGT